MRTRFVLLSAKSVDLGFGNNTRLRSGRYQAEGQKGMNEGISFRLTLSPTQKSVNEVI